MLRRGRLWGPFARNTRRGLSHILETINLNPSVYIPGSTLSINQRALLPGYGSVDQFSQDINASYNAYLRAGINGGLSPIPWYMNYRHQFDYGPSDFDRSNLLSISYVWQLPGFAHSGILMHRLLGDWELSGIVTAQSGAPITVLASGGPSQTGLGDERAVVNGPAYGSGACSSAPCVNYLIPSSFQTPPIGTFGTAGKGALRGPDLMDWDIGIFKNIPIHERLSAQFRVEFFNVLNNVNFSAPNATVGGAGFGSIVAAGDPRIGQLALKILF